MIEIFKMALSGFWNFCGVFILLQLPLFFIGKIIHICVRAQTIRRKGYPPPYCDGDGDFKKKE